MIIIFFSTESGTSAVSAYAFSASPCKFTSDVLIGSIKVHTKVTRLIFVYEHVLTRLL